MKHLPLLKLAVAVSLLSAGVTQAADDTSAQTPTTNADGSLSLGVISVTGEGVAGQSTTEGTGSYTTGKMSTATKLNLSPRETPQSVSVITRQRIEDKGMNDLNDVVQNAPGVTLQKYGADRQQFMSRGFKIDNIMYDGLATSVGTYTQDTISSADMAMFDRVEVVRGATGLMTGAGSPSATLNLVRKRPTDTPQVSVTTSAGSWDRYRTELDASNRLNESGTLRGRVVAAYQDNKSFQDLKTNQRQTFYGVLEADLNDSTTWTVGASKQRDDNRSDWGGIPSGPNGENLDLPRSSFLSNQWSYWDKDNYSFFTDVTHRFDNGWTGKLAAQKIWANLDSFAAYSTANTNGTLTQFSGHYINSDYQTNYDASLTGPFQLFGREHELSFGTSYRQERFDQNGGTLGGFTYNPYTFDHNAPKSEPNLYSWEYRNTATEKSAYAVARFNPIDPLHVIIGSRVLWYKWDDRAGDTDYNQTQKVTPYAGIVYDLNDTYSVYASYTQIFKPQAGVTVGGGALEPMTGENYEIGLKGAYLDGALNGSIALFDLTQEKRAYDLDAQCGAVKCSATAGEVRSQGIDAEISGAITPNWQASASYTYVLSQFVKDDDNKGMLFDPSQPKHLFKAATTYHLTGDLHKWRVGADLYAQSGTFEHVVNGLSNQSSYSVVGLMAGYRFNDHWDGRVNVNNLFDTQYWQGLPETFGGGIYGDPRNLMFSLKWTL